MVEALTPYYLTRWACVMSCGYFEVGTPKRLAPGSVVKCPQCGKAAQQEVEDQCVGRTTRPVPFITKPRGGVKMREIESPAFDGGKFRVGKRKRDARGRTR